MLNATRVVEHPECINCIMLIIYEWGHGLGVTYKTMQNVQYVGVGQKGEPKESLIETKNK